MQTLGEAETGQSRSAGLGEAVLRLARCRSGASVAAAVAELGTVLPGVAAAVVFSTDPRRASCSRRLPLPAADSSPRILYAGRQLEDVLAAGQMRTLSLPDPHLPKPTVPRSAQHATVVPCLGPGSPSALCLYWTPGRPAPRVDDEMLEVLAAAAGMALERVDAVRRERRARADLQNRLRNVAALIRSVSSRSAERAASLAEYTMHFEGRLDALLRPQIALARSADSRIDFEDLLRDELLAQGIQDGRRVELSGLPVSLVAVEAEAMGLAIHELATNAVKFGPFSDRGGSLATRWWAESDSERVVLRIDWREHCAQPLGCMPRRVGFGRQFLERAVPYELGAETSWWLSQRELICHVKLPLALPPAA